MNGIRTFHHRDGTARLVCFPHAGGGASAFLALSAALPDDIEVHAVQYPGRQDRRSEPCAEAIEDLAAQAATALAGYDDRPLFLLGHSMGALVAFETARLLRGRAAVTRLFASAARPPAADWAEPDVDALADEQIVGELRRLGGVPEPVLDDPEMIGEVLRQLRADVRALRRYRCGDDAAVAAPLTVLVGTDDPKNSVAQMRDWARHTTGEHVVETLHGGHFALTERAAEAAALLTRYIRTDIAERANGGDRANGTAPADLVREILVAGVNGRRPPLSTDLTTLEETARTKLPPDAFAYVAGTAGSGATGRANRAAFEERRLVPRMLRGAVHRDLTVRLAGQRLPAPVLLAPVAAQTVVHPQGELATARAAAEVGVPFVLSTFAAHSLEEVAEQSGRVPRWFQLYLPSDRAVAESLVRRAEAGGYTALVVTVDAAYLGFRPMELDNAYSPFLRGTGIANFTTDPAFRAGLPDGAEPAAMVRRWAEISIDPAATWDGLAWLRDVTDLPVFVKGILHPDDARLAVEHGARGLVVSNHGGRQLDGSTSALDALPAVRDAVAGRVPVLMDSGVRSGTDVAKALALGADAVLVGRPYVYGLGLSGQQGVEHVLRCLLAELDLALALTGCASPAELTPDLITDQRFRSSAAE
ncbi:alpha/beta fold hydrolase [Streptomyces macrosporus]|uniref:FMN hydroxy acid dehydrogenase domain-containing protein n=1 Tax=Streptomyces macrosporus TaxID=44032 RepID=A0ABP5WEC8_9ACTN